MSIINRILGRPDATIQATAATNGYPAYPQLSGVPTSNIPDTTVPATLGTDAYQPVSYQVPTSVPTLIPGAVTAWRNQEAMPIDVNTRQVQSIKEVPVETPVRAPRAPRVARPAPAVDAAEAPVGEETAATTARTASRTRAASKAAVDAEATTSTANAAETQVGEEVATTTRATKQVKTFKTKVEATPKLTSAGLLGAVKTSALVSGGISLALNGYAMLKGQETFAEGGSNVVGDVAAGAVGGLGGAVVSSFGAPLIASALGIAGGFPLTALTFGLGLGGYWLADKLFRKTSLFQSIKQDVFNLFSGHPGAIRTPAETTGYVPTGAVPTANASLPLASTAQSAVLP